MTPVATAPPSAQQRFEDRLGTVRRTRRRRLLRLALAVVVVGTLVWLVWFSPVLAVRSVDIVGLTGAEQRSVAALVGDQTGLPMARVDLDAVVARVRARPEVAEVRVDRSWPSTLTVQAVLRTPAMVLRTPLGALQVADLEGVVFAVVDKAPAGVPVVQLSGNGSPSPDAVAAALGLIRVLPPSLVGRVKDITVGSADRITFQVGSTTVVWGTTGQEELKLRIVQALLPHKTAVIDVSAPDTPVTRAKS